METVKTVRVTRIAYPRPGSWAEVKNKNVILNINLLWTGVEKDLILFVFSLVIIYGIHLLEFYKYIIINFKYIKIYGFRTGIK